MKARLLVVIFLFSSAALFAQQLPDGVFQGYDGEWRHVSEQLVALAEATPADKFAWCPAAGVRSTSEVYMHIVTANYFMLQQIGIKPRAELKFQEAKNITAKPEVIAWLKRSLAAVQAARAAETPQDLERKVHVIDRDVTVDGVYLRLIVHNNEHMGQLVAYARMTGVVPPWSQ